MVARIDTEQLWRDPALTLAGLARILGTNTTYLSRGLGAAAGENFNTIINRRRVAEMQQLLAMPTEQRDLLTLAFDVGFNSKASFNRAFLDLAGMSPSQWRLKSQKVGCNLTIEARVLGVSVKGGCVTNHWSDPDEKPLSCRSCDPKHTAISLERCRP